MSIKTITLDGTTNCRDTNGYEREVSADDCPRCEGSDLVLEFDTSDYQSRICCTACDRCTAWMDTERECEDCDSCGPHEVECRDHGREHTCQCSCVDDSCECECCIQTHSFEAAKTAWNDSEDMDNLGVPWCRSCGNADDDCSCPDIICDDCKVRPCECDPDACRCEVHEKKRTAPTPSTGTATISVTYEMGAVSSSYSVSVPAKEEVNDRWENS